MLVITPGQQTQPRASQTSRRPGRWLLILTLSVLLSACSMFRIGYNMAPTLLDWRISRYVTFNEAQQEIVDENLVALHEWHRKTQLPAYVAFLDQLTDRLSASDVRPGIDDLTRWRRQMMQAWNALPPVLSPAVADVVLTLSSGQLDQIKRQLVVDDARTAERYQQDASPAAQTEARMQRWQERAEWFLGDLTLTQKARLEERLKVAPSSSHWLKNRTLRRQQGFDLIRKFVTERTSRKQAVEQLHQWLSSYGRASAAANADPRQSSAHYADETMAQILALATPTQMRHLVSKLNGFATELRSLGGLPPRQI